MGHAQRSLIANAIWVSATPALRCAMVDGRAAEVVFDARPADQLPSLAILWARRDTLRLAVLECTTPFCAERMITGSASRCAARSCGPPCGRKECWAWLCSFCGRPVGPLVVVRPDIVKSERRREPRRQLGAYSRLAWERQRPAIGTLRQRAIDPDRSAQDRPMAAFGRVAVCRGRKLDRIYPTAVPSPLEQGLRQSWGAPRSACASPHSSSPPPSARLRGRRSAAA